MGYGNISRICLSVGLAILIGRSLGLLLAAGTCGAACLRMRPTQERGAGSQSPSLSSGAPDLPIMGAYMSPLYVSKQSKCLGGPFTPTRSRPLPNPTGSPIPQSHLLPTLHLSESCHFSPDHMSSVPSTLSTGSPSTSGWATAASSPLPLGLVAHPLTALRVPHKMRVHKRSGSGLCPPNPCCGFPSSLLESGLCSGGLEPGPAAWPCSLPPCSP